MRSWHCDVVSFNPLSTLASGVDLPFIFLICKIRRSDIWASFATQISWYSYGTCTFMHMTLEWTALVYLAEMATLLFQWYLEYTSFWTHVSMCISTDIQCSLVAVPEKENVTARELIPFRELMSSILYWNLAQQNLWSIWIN